MGAASDGVGQAVTFDISAAQAIDGWMSDAELQWLAEQASKHTRIVEVGSWKGRSTAALAQHTDGDVWAIDHWLGQLLTGDTSLDVEVRDRGADAIYNEFLLNMRNYGNVAPQRMSSADAAELASPGFDMVFLDGEHAYEGVSNDIALWTPLLATGGLLCGHDWWHEGIKRAVKEAVPGYQVAPGTNIWWATV